MKRRNLLLVNNSKNGALYPFPGNFDLPPSVSVGDPELQFFKTGRVKTVNGEICPVYTEKNAPFDLDEVSDPLDETEPTEQPSERQGTGYPITPNSSPNPPVASDLVKNADGDVMDELSEIIAGTDDYEELFNAIVKWHNNNLLNRL